MTFDINDGWTILRFRVGWLGQTVGDISSLELPALVWVEDKKGACICLHGLEFPDPLPHPHGPPSPMQPADHGWKTCPSFCLSMWRLARLATPVAVLSCIHLASPMWVRRPFSWREYTHSTVQRPTGIIYHWQPAGQSMATKNKLAYIRPCSVHRLSFAAPKLVDVCTDLNLCLLALTSLNRLALSSQHLP